MAAGAVGGGERLILVRFLQRRILNIVTVHAQGGYSLGQMKVVLLRQIGTGLVRHMAGVAAHVESRVTAALLWNVLALIVAGETEVFLFSADCRFQQLILVVAGVRVVAGEAVANRWLVNRTLNLCRVFFGVAAEAELVGRRGVSLTRVTSRLTRTSWQLRQPVAIAECTDFPLLFSSWHSRHFAPSTFFSSGTG